MPKLNWKQIEKHLPKRVSLHYVDARYVELNHMADQIQNMIHKNEIDVDFEGLTDEAWENIQEIKKELKKDLEADFSEAEIEVALEEFEEQINDYCYEKDNSNPIKEYLDACNMSFFYDTGYSMEPDSWRWNNKRTAKEVSRIMTHLNITKKQQRQHPLWNQLWHCVQNSGYGGVVEIYFTMTPWELLQMIENQSQIKFIKGTVGIVHHGNGSGYVGDSVRLGFILPFNVENVFVEKAVSYNWSYEIAGQSISYYEDTEFELGDFDLKYKKVLEPSAINDHIKRQNRFDEVYRKGGCSAGDMNISRHRKVEYINNYPCGNRCHDCGTFWID